MKKPKYTGQLSTNFWKHTNAIKGVSGGMLYNMVCSLQEVEHAYNRLESRALDELGEAEKKAKK